MQGPDGMESSDAELVTRVLHGEVNAYGALVSRYRDRYARYAVHMLGNREDAEEALQDAFTRAFRSLARCEEPERFGAWLFRILVNRCRTSGARRVRRGRTFVHDEAALMRASQEHPAEQTMWREEIERALGGLKPGQREAFLLQYVGGVGYDEMLEITRGGVSALKMRGVRARDPPRAPFRGGRS